MKPQKMIQKNGKSVRSSSFVRMATPQRRGRIGQDLPGFAGGLKATIEVNSSKSENLGQVLPGIEHTCPGVPSLFHKLGDRLNGEIGGVDLVQFIPANGE